MDTNHQVTLNHLHIPKGRTILKIETADFSNTSKHLPSYTVSRPTTQ